MSGPDGVEQGRDRLRRNAAQCWADVQNAVDAEDPEGLLRLGAPLDEYAPEVKDLVRLVQDELVTPSRVLEIWERWFGPNSSLDRHPEILQRLTVALTRIPPSEPQAPPRG
ncbi:MAG: hypothetical protein ACRDUV_13910 [Pseudonocardiaceae bacterium]